jgi:hypothetical protein
MRQEVSSWSHNHVCKHLGCQRAESDSGMMKEHILILFDCYYHWTGCNLQLFVRGLVRRYSSLCMAKLSSSSAWRSTGSILYGVAVFKLDLGF